MLPRRCVLLPLRTAALRGAMRSDQSPTYNMLCFILRSTLLPYYCGAHGNYTYLALKGTSFFTYIWLWLAVHLCIAQNYVRMPRTEGSRVVAAAAAP
jgi:hypothetical protein